MKRYSYRSRRRGPSLTHSQSESGPHLALGQGLDSSSRGQCLICLRKEALELGLVSGLELESELVSESVSV